MLDVLVNMSEAKQARITVNSQGQGKLSQAMTGGGTGAGLAGI